MIRFEKVIKDPLYEDYIGIRSEELEVIELPVFQRLRRVSQLSFADLVYPSANHNRFAHSLGVLHLAGTLGAVLKARGYIDDNDAIILRWAGLLHDIGHGPFSHAFEPVLAHFILKDGKPWTEAHVRHGQRLIYETPSIYEKMGGKETAKRVCSYISGEEYGEERPTALMRNIMKGLFSIDRLDYLRRDAYHAGTPEYGMLDIIRIINSFLWENDTVYHNKKGVYALALAIFSYFQMYQAMYFHHATRAAFCLCQDILWDAFKQGVFKDVEWKELWPYFDDFKCLEMIYTKANGETKEKISLLLNRKLPKRILDFEDLARIGALRYKMSELCMPEAYDKKMEIEYLVRKDLAVKTFYIDSPEIVPYPHPSKERELPLIAFDEDNPSLHNQALHEVAPYLTGLWHAPNIIRVYVEKKWVDDKRKQELKEKVLKTLSKYLT